MTVHIVGDAAPDFKVDTLTVGTTATQFPITAVPTRGVQLSASADNTGTIYIGKADVAAKSYPLAAGDKIFLPISNLKDLYLLGSDADQGYSYIWV